MTLPSQSAGHTPLNIGVIPMCPSCGGKVNTTTITFHRCQAIPEPGKKKCGWEQCGNAWEADYRYLLAENSKLKGQLEEAVGALKLIAGSTFKNCTFGNNAGGTTIVGVRIKSAAEIASETLSKLKEAGS